MSARLLSNKAINLHLNMDTASFSEFLSSVLKTILTDKDELLPSGKGFPSEEIKSDKEKKQVNVS